MLSPFPGMDPYLEAAGYWSDFHYWFIGACCGVLADRLPPNYDARIQEHVRLIEVEPQTDKLVIPDVAVLQSAFARETTDSPSSGTAMLEPVTIPYAMTVENRETWIEILRHPERDLVAVVEVLSPDNKRGTGRDQYEAKRLAILAQSVHLVELDLLIGGQRLPVRQPLPQGHYYALVGDSARRPLCNVYYWTLRQELPTIDVPLAPPDPPVPLDLAQAFTLAYQRGRYHRCIDYSAPLSATWGPDDVAWCRRQVEANTK
ncbi:MAG TPA: DUF4058 family protein [Pirellulales bacterium]|nr:DUF4058 family protein [Pirellulales bacterium]